MNPTDGTVPVTLKALTAGVVVGVIVIEAACAVVDLLTPDHELFALADHATVLSPVITAAVALAWLCGGAAGGAMSTAISTRRAVGWTCGLLLSLPPALIVLVTKPDTGLVAGAFLPLAGAVAGSVLAAALQATESGHHSNVAGAGL